MWPNKKQHQSNSSGKFSISFDWAVYNVHCLVFYINVAEEISTNCIKSSICAYRYVALFSFSFFFFLFNRSHTRTQFVICSVIRMAVIWNVKSSSVLVSHQLLLKVICLTHNCVWWWLKDYAVKFSTKTWVDKRAQPSARIMGDSYNERDSVEKERERASGSEKWCLTDILCNLYIYTIIGIGRLKALI